MRCLIVDDDEMSRNVLAAMCGRLEDITLVKACASSTEAMATLQQNVVDLILLDVEMPGLSGLEFVRSLSTLPQVILTTGKVEYAVEAFDLKVTDYLLKPLTFPRFVKAIDRARQLNKAPVQHTSDEIYVKADGRLIRLELPEISYIESLGDYVIFHRGTQEQFIVHSTLKNIDEKIRHHKFIRIHRSYIVNLSKIVDIQETNLVVDGKVLPISRAHRNSLFKEIMTL
jgi:DNA-binding LytR/AlgR family response regulator